MDYSDMDVKNLQNHHQNQKHPKKVFSTNIKSRQDAKADSTSAQRSDNLLKRYSYKHQTFSGRQKLLNKSYKM